MGENNNNNAFVFSHGIDGQYIIELYAGDYVMIAETFTDVLQEYDSFVQKVESCYQASDTAALKSAIHKIKPLFGFVGLTALQAQCLQFENTCLQTPSDQLIKEYALLKENLISAYKIIETEKHRLDAYNEG